MIKRTLKNTRKETLLKFYKVMAVPLILYGSEFWTLTKAQERRIEAVEMKFPTSVAGYTRLDMRRNEDIREELNIFKLKDKIKEYRVNWLEHVERMDRERAPKVLLKYRPRGRRNVGRPRKRWRDQL